MSGARGGLLTAASYTEAPTGPKQPPLRLGCVASALGPQPSAVHADIGSDHALLPLLLLETGRAGRVIAVEKHPGPLARSTAALAAHVAAGRACVRAGDGFGPLAPGEADSASVCGLGAARIAALLAAHPERVPPRLVLQSVDDPAPLRRWARSRGYHLRGETTVPGEPFCAVLSLTRRPGPDPAYDGWQDAAALELALAFGPWLLAAHDPNLAAELERQRAWLRRALEQREVSAFREKLGRLEAALGHFSGPG